MTGVRMLGVNTSRGTVTISVPSKTNIPQTIEVPIGHIRPYVRALGGTHWTSDNPSGACHPLMLVCSEPGCTTHATHNDGMTDVPFLCCSNHCMCFDKYTGAHIHADEYDVSVSTDPNPSSPSIPGDHEVYLSESKLRVYWDRVRDIKSKVKDGIEVIRFGKNVPEAVLKYIKKHILRLRRVFESADSGVARSVAPSSIAGSEQ